MRTFFMRNARSRPWLAMALAQIVAIQLLLAGFAVGRMATVVGANPFFICHVGGDVPTDTDPRGKHDEQTPCALCRIAAAAPAVLPVVAVPLLAYAPRAVSYVLAPVAPYAPRHPTPRLSQGPPQIG